MALRCTLRDCKPAAVPLLAAGTDWRLTADVVCKMSLALTALGCCHHACYERASLCINPDLGIWPAPLPGSTCRM